MVTCPARAPRHRAGCWGFESGVSGPRGAGSGVRSPVPAAAPDARLYPREAAALVRSAGRGRGHREGALTAAGPAGTPPPYLPQHPLRLPARPEIWGGDEGAGAGGGRESELTHAAGWAAGAGHFCTQR